MDKPLHGCFLKIGSFKQGLGLLQRVLGLTTGRFRADPYENEMFFSISQGLLSVAVLVIRALLFGVYIRAPDVFETPAIPLP